MAGKTRKIILSDFDQRLLVALLVEYRNKLLEESRSTEEIFELLVKQFSAIEGVTEDLKATDRMAWVARMNNIHNQAKEIVHQELIYG